MVWNFPKNCIEISTSTLYIIQMFIFSPPLWVCQITQYLTVQSAQNSFQFTRHPQCNSMKFTRVIGIILGLSFKGRKITFCARSIASDASINEFTDQEFNETNKPYLIRFKTQPKTMSCHDHENSAHMNERRMNSVISYLKLFLINERCFDRKTNSVYSCLVRRVDSCRYSPLHGKTGVLPMERKEVVL